MPSKKEDFGVERLMASPVRCCRPEDGLNQAARIMWEADCGLVPVIAADESGAVLGVITDRDVCMAAYTQGKTLGEIPVADVMTREVHCCKPAASLEEAQSIMRNAQVRRLPVVDDAGRLVGLLSLSDLAQEACRERAPRTKAAVKEAEIGETLARVSVPRRSAESRPERAKRRPRPSVRA